MARDRVPRPRAQIDDSYSLRPESALHLAVSSP
jgi:hypothetical protein